MNLIKLIPFSVRERIRKIVFGKNHFHDVVEYLAAIAPGAKVFDVGAQHGYETILCAKSGMWVWAFEPNIPAREKMWSNLVLEGVDGGVRLSYMAVADKFIPGRVTTCADAMNFYGTSPDFLKIDTDGSDLKVIEG